MEKGVSGADEDEFRTAFEVMMEQVNWCRRAECVKPVGPFSLVCMERTAGADTEWDDDDEGMTTTLLQTSFVGAGYIQMALERAEQY